MNAKDDASYIAPVLHLDSAGQPLRQLVLLGGGHAHLHVLASLADKPLPGLRIILVSPHPYQTHPALLPDFVAGHHALEDCLIPLEPLVRRAGIRWIQHSVTALDADRKIMTMDDGSTLTFDWLSINTGATQSRDQIDLGIPGARNHGLFVRPFEAFSTLWPRVVELGATRALRIAVIGAGATGIELACAIRQRLPNAALTLVAGPVPVGAEFPHTMQLAIHEVLRNKGITVLQDTVTSIEIDQVHLGCGARLACDVPLLATGVTPPAWLADSGLALDANGFVAVDAYQQSTSHSCVFAAGDVSTRTDRALARNGVYATLAGPALLRNLGAATSGAALKAHKPPARSLQLLSCGGHYAIALWGKHSFKGYWVWWLKHWMDRKFVTRYKSDPP